MHFTFYREFISFAVIKSILFISRFFEVIKIIIEFIIFHLIYTDRKLFELFIVKMAYRNDIFRKISIFLLSLIKIILIVGRFVILEKNKIIIR